VCHAPAMAGRGGGSSAMHAFFAGGQRVVLAVYDTRRGQVEGHETDRVLAFRPADAAPGVQAGIVGLAQALTMFGGTFNKECPVHTMEAERHVWTMYHAEPDLWLLLVVPRGLIGHACLASSLAALLRGVHSTAVLLHGLLGPQLQLDPRGGRVRARLQPLLEQAASALLAPEAAGLWPLSSPLGMVGGVPLLPISPAAFTSACAADRVNSPPCSAQCATECIMQQHTAVHAL
jgi:First Longin domain of INTU, CCZ1 and HPS4